MSDFFRRAKYGGLEFDSRGSISCEVYAHTDELGIEVDSGCDVLESSIEVLIDRHGALCLSVALAWYAEHGSLPTVEQVGKAMGLFREYPGLCPPIKAVATEEEGETGVGRDADG